MWFLIERDTTTVRAISDTWTQARAIYEGEDATWHHESDLGSFLNEQVFNIVGQAATIKGYPLTWVIDGGRVSVFRMPQVGDDISYGFNGDCYPCGKAIKVTQRMVETDEGKKFFWSRKAKWFYYNQSWALIIGHVDKRNPEF